MQILNEIARELQRQQNSKITTALFGTGLVLGTITPSMKLKLDNFKHELDFMRLQTSNWLEIEPAKLNNVFWYNTKYDISQDKIAVEMKVELKLEPGDRVLVAIVNNGSDHVVVGKVI